ncbi:protein TIFY 5A-like [Carica papaya]|uniref:protein TIFY 5A-like n=1 Tax=Carica papaya TaxID=3649 RepID=UPI000B8CA399|nr:protein TIFY 5A-like [Carica papaya]
MRRNCNLELRLLPPSDPRHEIFHLINEEITSSKSPQTEQLTIFYNGKVCVSNVTELQAKAILFIASRETMEEKPRTPTELENGSSTQIRSNIANGLSMKRSLQRFLQKRKHSIRATSPY